MRALLVVVLGLAACGKTDAPPAPAGPVEELRERPAALVPITLKVLGIT